ncbi:MAG: SWIM zinc finger family protein [Deltaproteobacteria bacterium]|jgi:uncharacterized Zn finger protein/DNA-binding transcriptional regulator YiaG|nr:SWIM zinc finger family protein [Deltaproteobacteria bacterium]
MFFRKRTFYTRPSASQKRAAVKKSMARFSKTVPEFAPVMVQGMKMTSTFWGQSWCEHFEKMADYENRLPRGRTYARNGSIVHLELGAGSIYALVAGSDVYEVSFKIKPLERDRWDEIKRKCHGKIDSMIDLLKGRFSEDVMAVVCDPETGIFPLQNEVFYNCTCPDFAGLCKHVAAVFYGIGNRLDSSPELIFKLRRVDPLDLFTVKIEELAKPDSGEELFTLAGDLEKIFNVVLEYDLMPREKVAFPDADGAEGPVGSLPARRGETGEITLPAPDEDATRAAPPTEAETEAVPKKAWKTAAKTEPALPAPPKIVVPDDSALSVPSPRPDRESRALRPEPQERREERENRARLFMKIPSVPASAEKIEPRITFFDATGKEKSAKVRKVAILAPTEREKSVRVPEKSIPAAAEKKKSVLTPKEKKIKDVCVLDFSRIKGSDFKKMRLVSGYSEEELASMIGVASSTYKRWEGTSGPLNLRDSTLKLLNHFYDKARTNPNI